MKTVMISGSRRISVLPASFRRRIDEFATMGCSFVLGDANGADKAAQRYLAGLNLQQVSVYCSGAICRNNLGLWHEVHVEASASRGYAHFASKDRAMATIADIGLCLWDGHSPGTIINALRLLNRSKQVELHCGQRQRLDLSTIKDWISVYEACDAEVKSSIRERATGEQWPIVSVVRQFELAI